MKSGTVHDQDGAGLANGLPARSVMVDAKLTAKTPGSAKEVGSPITIEAVVPSGLSVAVLATVFAGAGSYATGHSFVTGLVPALWVGFAVLAGTAAVIAAMPWRSRQGIAVASAAPATAN